MILRSLKKSKKINIKYLPSAENGKGLERWHNC